METQLPGPSGLLGSLRTLADGLIGSVHDRNELFSVELQEEKQRLVQTLIWASVVVFLATLTLTFVSFAFVVYFWDTARTTVVTVIALGYVVALVVAILGFKRFLKQQPRPFDATLRELRNDRSCLPPET